MELSRPVPTFCDVCNKIAFGLLLQCANCGLICHQACQSRILFHCQSDLERTIKSGREKVILMKFIVTYKSRKRLAWIRKHPRLSLTQFVGH